MSRAAYQSLMVFNTDFNPSPSSLGVHGMPRGINWEDQAWPSAKCSVLRPSKMAADKSEEMRGPSRCFESGC